jgi:hypothetical protein
MPAETGAAEAEFARNDLRYEFKKIFVMRKPARSF